MNAHSIHKVFVKVMNCGRLKPAVRKCPKGTDMVSLLGEVIKNIAH